MNVFVGILIAQLVQKDLTKNILTISLLSLILSLNGTYGIIISLAFLLLIVFDEKLKLYVNKYFAIAILLFGVSAGLLTSIPPNDFHRNSGYNLTVDTPQIKKTISKVWDAYIPIPKTQINFWNNNILEPASLKFKPSVLLVAAVAVLLLVYKNYKALFFYLTGTGLLLLFSYIKFSGVLRHDGHLFIVFLLAYLISQNRGYWLRILMTYLLVVQFSASVVAASYEWKHPFTIAKEISEVLQKKNDYLVVADDDARVSGVVFHLDEPAYYPKSEKWGTYIIWNEKQTREINNADRAVLSAFDLKAQNDDRDIFLVMSYELDEDLYPVELFYKSGESIVTKRSIWVYTL